MEVRDITRLGVAAAAAAAAVRGGGGSGRTVAVAAAGADAAHLGSVAAALLSGSSPIGWAPAPALEGRPLAQWQRGLEASITLLSSIADPSDPASVPWSFRLSDFARPGAVLEVGPG
jgi:hypothetical protein